MQKHGLFDSPSFITCSDSNSDENSSNVHKKKQTGFNVPQQKCKVNLRRVFGRTKELPKGNPLKDYLMKIQLPVVTSTPVNEGSPVVCDSLLKLTPIRKNRNSNIASQFVKNVRRSLNNNSPQTLNKRRKSRSKRKFQNNSKSKHRKVELTQSQALKDEDLLGIEPLYKSGKLNFQMQSLTSETSQLNHRSDVLHTPQNSEIHKPSKVEIGIEIERVLSELDTSIAEHLSIISLSSTLKNVKQPERKIIPLSDRKLRSSSKNNTTTSTIGDLKLQQSSATRAKSKRKIELVTTNEETQVNCKPDVQSKRKRTVTVKENPVRDISQSTADNNKSKMKELNSTETSIEVSLDVIKRNKELNETELVKSKQDIKATNEKNYSSVLPTVNEEIQNECEEDETLKATEHSPLKRENIKSAEKSKQRITKKLQSSVLENEKIQDVHEVDSTTKAISGSPCKENTELHVKLVEKAVKSKRGRKPKTEKAIPQPHQEETVSSSKMPVYSSDSSRYGLRSNTRKQQCSSVVLQQYIVNRKSGFIEVCDRTSFDDSTKDSIRGNGRLRRNVKKPKAYVQATYCSSNVYKILGKSTAKRRTNNNIDKTKNLEAENSSNATEKQTVGAAKTKKGSQANKKNAKKQTQDLDEKQMPVLESISKQCSLTASSASNTSIEKRTTRAAKTRSQTNGKNAKKQAQDLDEKQMPVLESFSKPVSLMTSLASNTSSVAGPTTRISPTKKESPKNKNNAKKQTQDLVEKKMPVLESISEQLSSTVVSLASSTSGEFPNEDCFKRPTGRAVKKSKTQKTTKDAKELFFSSANPSNDSVLHSSLGLDEVYESNSSDICPNKQLMSNNGSSVSLDSSKRENISAEFVSSRSSAEKYPSSNPKRVTVHQNIALKNTHLHENTVVKPFNSKNCCNDSTQSSDSEIDKRRTKEIIQCVVNNRTTMLEWYCPKPKFDERQNVGVVYGLTNLKSHMGISSCGYVRFGPGQEKSQVPRKYVITYKVENGSALVSQQFVTKEMTTGMIFYIPLGSPYRIKNLSKTEPLILFFSKISQM